MCGFFYNIFVFVCVNEYLVICKPNPIYKGIWLNEK